MLPDLNFYKEQLQSKEDMLARTTSFLMDAQLALKEKNYALNEINNDLLNSITFAGLIQRSLLPDAGLLQLYFKDAAYLVKQQMGIGGDTVFIKKTSQGICFGLLDSTGHGIPAAMLSISGTLILNELIAGGLTDAKEITRLLNLQLNSTYNHRQSIAHMEGSIFHFSTGMNNLSYCSAKGKLIYIPLTDDLCELPHARQSIGEDALAEYENTALTFKKGDKLFLYSDGVTDQFGGNRNKKFSKSRLKKLLLLNRHKSVAALKALVEQELEAWKASTQQTDDLSFMILEF